MTPSTVAAMTRLTMVSPPALLSEAATAPVNAASIGADRRVTISASICRRAAVERGLSVMTRLNPRSAASHLFAFLSSLAMRMWAAELCGLISRVRR